MGGGAPDGTGGSGGQPDGPARRHPVPPRRASRAETRVTARGPAGTVVPMSFLPIYE
ncbi:hypothetical protein K701_11585 [Streptomyces fradiae ATCC 10745 = DSM 40063]|uniref:Uncharacterized protein n=1 Tax=Streptomyces fradiae ATCC 10745 = DSM 40063 TaxID=1319510 RepID=A0ABQ6XVF8_STRFR|nr:hypothetical protein K701_11585 [Streptomyces fradiae ATCC 10745 = DSM 40063]